MRHVRDQVIIPLDSTPLRTSHQIIPLCGRGVDMRRGTWPRNILRIGQFGSLAVNLPHGMHTHDHEPEVRIRQDGSPEFF